MVQVHRLRLFANRPLRKCGNCRVFFRNSQRSVSEFALGTVVVQCVRYQSGTGTLLLTDVCSRGGLSQSSGVFIGALGTASGEVRPGPLSEVVGDCITCTGKECVELWLDWHGERQPPPKQRPWKLTLRPKNRDRAPIC